MNTVQLPCRFPSRPRQESHSLYLLKSLPQDLGVWKYSAKQPSIALQEENYPVG